MALESPFAWFGDLDKANPTASDNVSQGDDHIRGLKTVLLNQFPNMTADTAVTATEAELNYNDITTLGTTENSKTVTTDSSGVINLASGNLKFPATQNPSADANTLDDYEEGDLSPPPGIAFGGASVSMTFSAQVGTYTKVGRLVTVNGYIVLSAKGSSTGDAVITGLPFTVPNADKNLTPISLSLANVTFADRPQGNINKNATTIALTEVSNAGTKTTLTHADFTDTSEVIFSVTYSV